MNENSTRRYGSIRRIGAALVVAGVVGVGAVSLGVPASADDPAAGPITVDGTDYDPSQVSGPVWHYETPTPSPSSARVAARQQVWTGHGSENLPCPGGIHWVSNNNLLTVSHCLGVTSTSEVSSSTSEVSSSTSEVSSSTSEVSSSTSEVSSSTSEVSSSTSEVSSSTSEVSSSTSEVSSSTSEVSSSTSEVSSSTSEVQLQLPPGQPEQPLPSAPPLVVAAVPASAPSQSLPTTGSENWMLFFVAMIMFGAGAVLVDVARHDPTN